MQKKNQQKPTDQEAPALDESTSEHISPETVESSAESQDIQKPSAKSRLRQKLNRLRSKKMLPAVVIMMLLLLISGAAYIVPQTRYKLLNTVGSADAKITVLNGTTKQPISEAIVTLANGSSSTTDKDGVAFFDNTKYGKTTATIQKNTYESKTLDITINKDGVDLGSVDLKAIGVPVNINARNWLSGKSLGAFSVSFEGNDADAVKGIDGIASLNIPYETPKVNLKIKADGYNELSLAVDIDDKTINKEPSSKDNVSVINADMVIGGEHYFLSDREGDISFYSAQYDGSNVQKLVSTNQKRDYLEYYSIPNTEDYIALFTSDKKDLSGRQDQLAVIKPDEKSLKIVDEAPGQKLDFSVIAVTKESIIYQVMYDAERADKVKIKSYNFATGKLTTHYSFSAFISPAYDTEHNTIYLVESIGTYPYDPGFTRKLISINLANNSIKSIAEGSALDYPQLPPSKPGKLMYIVYEAYYNTVQPGYYLMDLADNSKVEYLGKDWPEFKAPDEIPDSEKGQASPNKTNRVWIDQRDSKGRLILNDSSNLVTGKIDDISINNIIRWVSETQLTVAGYDGSGAADFIVDVETGNYKKITSTLIPQYGGY